MCVCREREREGCTRKSDVEDQMGEREYIYLGVGGRMKVEEF